MKLLYDGKEVANIATNKSLTLEECFYLAGIDIDEAIKDNPSLKAGLKKAMQAQTEQEAV